MGVGLATAALNRKIAGVRFAAIVVDGRDCDAFLGSGIPALTRWAGLGTISQICCVRMAGVIGFSCPHRLRD